MDSLIKIWGKPIEEINTFLIDNNITISENNIQNYILASKISSDLGLLSSFESELVNLKNFKSELSQRDDIPPDQIIIFGLLSLADHWKIPKYQFLDDYVFLNHRYYNSSVIVGLLNSSGLDVKDPFNPKISLIDSLFKQNKVIPRNIRYIIRQRSPDIFQIEGHKHPNIYDDFYKLIKDIYPNITLNITLCYANVSLILLLTDPNQNIEPKSLRYLIFELNLLMDSVKSTFPIVNLILSLNLTNEEINEINFPNSINKLDLSNNRLTTIPVNIPKCLDKLDLSFNNLNNNSNFSRYTLRWLNLSDNNLITMSNLILPKYLDILVLRYNNISQIDENVIPSSLSILFIEENPLILPHIPIRPGFFGTRTLNSDIFIMSD